MTYIAGIGPRLAAFAGQEPTLPGVACDHVGCHAWVDAKPTRGGAPLWLINGKAPKGWGTFVKDGVRRHMCPTHRKKAEETNNVDKS